LLALSTTWGARAPDRPLDALERCLGSGFTSMEVDGLAEGRDIDGMVRLLAQRRASALAVSREDSRDASSSAPLPSRAGLSSPDSVEREEAVLEVERLVGWARRLRCPTVLLSGGFLMEEGFSDLQRRLRRSGLLHEAAEDDDSVAQARSLVMESQDVCLDALCRSLHAVTRSHPDVRFCLLPGRRVHELPDAEQLEMVFSEVGASNLAYWHDTATCHVMEKLGWGTHEGWLLRHASRTAGCIVQDYADLESGLVPGTGEVDFSLVADCLPRRTDLSLWISRSFGVAALHESRAFLEKVGFSTTT